MLTQNGWVTATRAIKAHDCRETKGSQGCHQHALAPHGVLSDIIIIITFTREGPAGFYQPRQIAPARA
jgi:hypothetical protein